MNQKIYIIDRTDQVDWYVDPKVISFYVDLKDNKREVREWLEEMTTDTVVICGQGHMPRPGTTDNVAFTVFHHLNRHQYRVYFADEKDAMLFKLAWGGSQ